jgi:hypothetical protein
MCLGMASGEIIGVGAPLGDSLNTCSTVDIVPRRPSPCIPLPEGEGMVQRFGPDSEFCDSFLSAPSACSGVKC